jgi:hypothetical protein
MDINTSVGSIVSGTCEVTCEDGTILEATYVAYCPPPRSAWAEAFAARVSRDPAKAQKLMRAHYDAAVRETFGGGR